MARSTHTTPQQSKIRLYGRKARKMRLRDKSISLRHSWQDWPDERAGHREDFDWNSQDSMTMRQIADELAADDFMDMLYALEFPKEHYAPHVTQSPQFHVVCPARPSQAPVEKPHREERTSRQPMDRDDYRALSRGGRTGRRHRVRLVS